MANEWKTLDTKKVLDQKRKQQEATTSAGVGGFAVPLGTEPLRPAVRIEKRKKTRKK